MAKSELIETPAEGEVVTVVPDNNTALNTEQALTANFDDLAGMPHDQVTGADAESKRGRPRMTEEEREVARIKKRERDKQYREAKRPSKTKTRQAAAELGEDAGLAAAAVHLQNAQLVTAAINMLCRGISGGEYQETDSQNAATTATWAAYLADQGIALPPWVQVAVISSIHIGGAFSTPTGKGRISGMWAKIKAWYIARRG